MGGIRSDVRPRIGALLRYAAVLVVHAHCTCGATFRLDAEANQAAQVATKFPALVGKERSRGLHGVSNELVPALRPLADDFPGLWEVGTPAESAGNLVICPSCICRDLVLTKVPGLPFNL